VSARHQVKRLDRHSKAELALPANRSGKEAGHSVIGVLYSVRIIGPQFHGGFGRMRSEPDVLPTPSFLPGAVHPRRLRFPNSENLLFAKAITARRLFC
jgi:hypothetical protein